MNHLPDAAERHGESTGVEGGPKSLRDMRKAHIEQMWNRAGGDEEKTAALLEIPVTELRRWMTKLGIR